ncbi:MAG: efflux RND transporter periplasmic adaptor subunit [Acetobacteraceae bacterium]
MKAHPNVTVSLANDPSVQASAVIREIAPQADPVTRLFQVKASLVNPPEGMRLGSTVNLEIRMAQRPGIEIPASALTEANNQPAVWVVDPANITVSLRGIDIKQFSPASVVVSKGLATGDIVVTAGAHELHPNQPVRLLGAS